MARSNQQVAAAFAEKKTATGDNIFTDGEVIYSYGSHFPIARHVEGVVLFTTRVSSVTTSQHKSLVRSALNGATVYKVRDVRADGNTQHTANVAALIQERLDAHGKAKRARNEHNRRFHFEDVARLTENINAYAEKFGVPVAVSQDVLADLATYKLAEGAE